MVSPKWRLSRAKIGGRRLERHGDAIHAIAQAVRTRSVIEHMAEMSAAAVAVHLGARHGEKRVVRCADRIIEGLPEARPAGPAVELGLRGEQGQVAARAGEGSRAQLVI